MRTSPLVSCDWLFAQRENPRVVIVDVRWYLSGKKGRDVYLEGHLPGALFADIDVDLAGPPAPSPGGPGRHPLPLPEHFAGFLARSGIAKDDTVVAYDDSGGSTAARLWWLLRYFGWDNGKVVNGGIQAWSRAGYPLETIEQPRTANSTVDLLPRHQMVMGKAEVAAWSSRSEGLLLDARATPRFEGRVEPIDARPGHIPGARSAPFTENLTEPAGIFRNAEELELRYRTLGAGSRKPVVAYCGSGVTACHDLLALSVAGLEGGLLYEGSWSDWAADSALPAQTGPERAEGE